MKASSVRVWNDDKDALVMTHIGRRLAPGAAPVPIYAYLAVRPAKRWRARGGELKER